jgi:predicted TIM-barrel fold metal-dependent hydrolase
MDAAGVDGSVLVSPFATYRYDASYALEVQARHPGRFGLVKPVDPTDRAVADDIAAWAAMPGTIAIRLMLSSGPIPDAGDPGLATVMTAAARHRLPVNLFCWGRLHLARDLAASHPGTQIVIDHLGLAQPFAPPVPADPFADLPKVLELAAFDNIAIKISNACTLSHRPYPFADIWDPLARIFDAFGLRRCMWGTDWTRALAFLTFEQGVEAFRSSDRLSQSDKDMLMGGALQRIYDWAPQPS